MAEHFIIAGAQRSGTTWLYHQFERHPSVCMARPLRPEPKFFLRQDAVSKGYGDYRERHFAHWSGEPLLGEKSTSYIERTDSIARIRAVIPDVSLVFVLRDPVRRAYSNWRFSRQQGIESLSFEEALAPEPVRVSAWNESAAGVSVCPFAYATRGHYARYLEDWSEHFPRERIAVTTSESLFAGGHALSDLFSRFGLDLASPDSGAVPVNASEDDDDGYPEPATAEVLRERYEADMRVLQHRWKLDLSAWFPNP